MSLAPVSLDATARVEAPRARRADGIGARVVATSADVLAAISLAAASIACAMLASRYGVNLRDATVQFHYATQWLQGVTPYRDTVYQTGPLPLFLETLAQWLAPGYLTSVMLGIAVRVGAVLAVYIACRTRVGVGLAWLAAMPAALLVDQVIHSSYDTAMAAALVAGAGAAWAGRTGVRGGSAALGWGVAGAGFAAIFATRQSNGVVTTAALAAVVFGVMVTAALRHGAARRAVARGAAADAAPWLIGAGVVGGAVVAWLLASGAAGEAMRQVFLEAGEKKPLGPGAQLANALTGGAWFLGRVATAARTLGPVVLLGGFVAGVWLVRRGRGERPAAGRTLAEGAAIGCALSLVGAAVLATWQGAPARAWADGLALDTPRVAWMALLAGYALRPRATSHALGVPLAVGAVLAVLALGEYWAVHMSWLGRAKVHHALGPMTIVLLMLTPRLGDRLKLGFAVAMVLAAGFSAWEAAGRAHPEGMVRAESAFAEQPRLRAALAGMHVREPKSRVMAAVAERVPPGRSLFCYGGGAVWYSLLEARNPTRLDMVYPDFISEADADEAVARLQADPPTWLLTGFGPSFHGRWATVNPLEIKPATGAGSAPRFGFNERAARVLHAGVVELVDVRYELVFDARHIVAADAGGKDVDRPDLIRLYRLRDDSRPPRP